MIFIEEWLKISLMPSLLKASKPRPRLVTTLISVVGHIQGTVQSTQLLTVASSLAYTTILSIIPALAVSFAIFQAFGGLEKVYAGLEPLIVENLAQGASLEATNTIRGFLQNTRGSAMGLGGLIGLIFTSMSMLSSIEGAFHRIWQVPNTRKLFNRIANYWLFITLGPIAMAVGVGAASTSELPLHHLLPSGSGLLVLTTLVFAFAFKYVPSAKVRWRPALIAALVTALFWNIARAGFTLYTAKAVSYSKIYGSLSAIPLLLLWIYLNWVVTLLGAALSVALQKHPLPEQEPNQGA